MMRPRDPNEALRESEARLQLALDAAELGLWEHDLVHDRMRLDARAQSLYGLDAVTSIDAITDRVYAGDQARLLGEIGAATDPRRRAAVRTEYRVVRDDAVRWLRVQGRVEFDGDSPAARPLRGIGTVQDVTAAKAAEHALLDANARLEERVQARTRQLRELARQLTLADQEERRRVSQILHDELQQMLYGIQLKVALLERNGDAAPGTRRQAEVQTWLGRAIDLTRQLTVDLSPPVLAHEGLADALLWLQRQLADLHTIEFGITAQHEIRIADADLRVLLFQCVRELLMSMKRYCGIAQAHVELRQDGDQIVIEISDRGRGLDATQADQSGGNGLSAMRERLRLFGGDMRITPQPGGGTRALLTAPLAGPLTAR
jgi:two-component system, chemotaxis family, CheB/CheR fusion protein